MITPASIFLAVLVVALVPPVVALGLLGLVCNVLAKRDALAMEMHE